MSLIPTPGAFRPGMLTREACEMLDRMARQVFGSSFVGGGGLDTRDLTTGPQAAVRKSALAPILSETISISARKDNYDPGIFEYLPVSATGTGFGFTGFQAPVYLGKVLTIRNAGANAFTLYETNGYSIASAQLYNSTAADLSLAPSESTQYLWDGAKWVEIADAKSGGSGPFPSSSITFSGASVALSGTLTNAQTSYQLTLAADIFDTDSYRSGNTLAVPSAGYYLVTGQVSFLNNGTGTQNGRLASVVATTGATVATAGAPQTKGTGLNSSTFSPTILNFSKVFKCGAGETFKFYAESDFAGDSPSGEGTIARLGV